MHRLAQGLLLLLVFLFSVSLKAQIKQNAFDHLSLPWIHFIWEGDSVGGHYYQKTAITIPVKIEDLKYHFKLQLDIGSSNSLFYGNSISNFIKFNPVLRQKLDTLPPFLKIQNKDCPVFKNLNLTFDKILMPKISIADFRNYGDSIPYDSLRTFTYKLIGTLGQDIFKGKILMIDYLHQRMAILGQLPELFKSISYVPLKIEKGKVKITLAIDGKPEDVMFDTGSSIFPFLTSKIDINLFSKESFPILDSASGNQSGKNLSFYSKAISSAIQIGDFILPPLNVYYIDQKSFHEFETYEEIVGIIGNAAFSNNIVVLDFKDQKFGVTQIK